MATRRLRLNPSGDRSLSDLLLQAGVEFPCGGEGSCGDCRIRVLSGEVPASGPMRRFLSDAEIHDGFRLGCCATASGTVELEVEQWRAIILSDDSSFRIEQREGLGAVVDVGTTTLVVQCVDLASGEVLASETALNPQVRYGADVMTRVQQELCQPGRLGPVIRRQIGDMLAQAVGVSHLTEILLVGNTVMHHLFCGYDVAPLAAVPFRTERLGAGRFKAETLGWNCGSDAIVTFLPCIGGFVGSDILAGMVACELGEHPASEALLDLGTNGEIALWDGKAIYCASTAAGPAFEGGGISTGMRAGPGAIDHVDLAGGALACHVIGGGEARGICGSGLLDAVACALESGRCLASGKIADATRSVPLMRGLCITQRDIREFQLAKGAVASGLHLVSARSEAAALSRVHMAGAFGNYMREASARRTGLLPGRGAPVHAAGNSALRGARMMLLRPTAREATLRGLLDKSRHVELAALPDFQEAFADALAFPE